MFRNATVPAAALVLAVISSGCTGRDLGLLVADIGASVARDIIIGSAVNTFGWSLHREEEPRPSTALSEPPQRLHLQILVGLFAQPDAAKACRLLDGELISRATLRDGAVIQALENIGEVWTRDEEDDHCWFGTERLKVFFLGDCTDRRSAVCLVSPPAL